MTVAKRPALALSLFGIAVAACALRLASSAPQEAPPEPGPQRSAQNIQIVLPNPQNPFDIYLDVADGPESGGRAIDLYLLWDWDKLEVRDGWGRSVRRFEPFDAFVRTRWTGTLDAAGNYKSPGFLLEPKQDEPPPYIVLAYYAHRDQPEPRASDARIIARARTPAETEDFRHLLESVPPLPPVDIKITSSDPNSGVFTAILSLSPPAPLTKAVVQGYDVYVCWKREKYNTPRSDSPPCPFSEDHRDNESHVYKVLQACYGNAGSCVWSEDVQFVCAPGSAPPRYVNAHFTYAGDRAEDLAKGIDDIKDDNACPN